MHGLGTGSDHQAPWFIGLVTAWWAARAGTRIVAEKPRPVHPGPGGFSDPLVGVMVLDSAGNTQISFRDTIDTELTISIRSPNKTIETLPVVTIDRGERQLCSVPESVSTNLYAVCGKTRLTITLFAATLKVVVGTSDVTGQLAKSGPLN
jgi:hypothetical protein